MKRYIFVTDEGHTESQTNDPVENLQVLGISNGNTEVLARERLIEENSWIIESGFDIEKAYAYELA